MKKVVVTGGNGNFSKHILSNVLGREDYQFLFFSKDKLDVRFLDSIESVLDREKPDILLHAGAITRPMVVHKKNPEVSIETNIVGTSNCVIACLRRGIKMVYISTDYVYPGDKGDYKEADPVFPVNQYAWSKLGGECAVKMYSNSLILRVAMVEDPFPHDRALVDSIKSPISQQEAAQICVDLLEEKGTINVGGKAQSIYDFVKQKKNIGKITLSNILDVEMPSNSSLNIDLMKRKIEEKKRD